MTWLQKILVLIATVMILCVGSYMAGSTAVRNEWNIEKAKIQAVADAEKARNLKAIKELNDAHQKEIAHAKTKAARDAVNRWLREHGVLSDGAPVRDCASPSAADSAKVPDAGREEQRTSASLEGFAINCADDASRLTDWQTLCKSQGCVVAD